jgi:hypothetical protein
MPAHAAIQHVNPLLLGWAAAFAGTSGTVDYAASAFFSAALTAPDVLIAPISFSE